MLPNSMYGVIICGDSNTIGSLEPGYGNTISGCALGGILVEKEAVSSHIPFSNHVYGNRIGTDISGTKPIANRHGIIVGAAVGVDIGGHLQKEEANTIAYSDSDGVRIQEPASAVRVSGNSIFGNGMVGIDLVGGTEDGCGCTQNDPGDHDTGANGLQNCPVITRVDGGAVLYLEGSLNARPDTIYTLEFFVTPGDISPTHGYGQQFLTWTQVHTDANGDASFNTTVGQPVGPGRAITATATDAQGNTSEFSAPFVIVTGVGPNPEALLPRETALLQNYPNPFNPKTGVRFQVAGGNEAGVGDRGPGSSVKLVVYDLLGREVTVLVDERKAPGSYEVSFDGSNLASGVYIYRMTAGSFTAVKTMLLVK